MAEVFTDTLDPRKYINTGKIGKRMRQAASLLLQFPAGDYFIHKGNDLFQGNLLSTLEEHGLSYIDGTEALLIAFFNNVQGLYEKHESFVTNIQFARKDKTLVGYNIPELNTLERRLGATRLFLTSFFHKAQEKYKMK